MGNGSKKHCRNVSRLFHPKLYTTDKLILPTAMTSDLVILY